MKWNINQVSSADALSQNYVYCADNWIYCRPKLHILEGSRFHCQCCQHQSFHGCPLIL